MPEIYLTPDMLTSTASKMDAQQEVLNGFLTKVDNVVNNLLADWKGDAQTAFAKSWEEKKGTYRQFTADISQFSDFLRSYAGTMQNLDAGQAPKI
ncbi:MAG: WXG100 family type VII secretion target [Synergistaceae bacterium]|nr:WXG100 family type VII secretion target [Synergistaceae bacterium]